MLLPERPQILDSPEIEHAKIIQGDLSVTAKPGEDHLLHLEAHEAFKKADLFKDSPKEYKKFLDEHIRQTKTVAMTEISQEQALGQGMGQAQQGQGARSEEQGQVQVQLGQPNPMSSDLPNLPTPGEVL